MGRLSITLERTQEAGSVYVLKEAPRKLKNDNFTKKQKAFDWHTRWNVSQILKILHINLFGDEAMEGNFVQQRGENGKRTHVVGEQVNEISTVTSNTGAGQAQESSEMPKGETQN